MTRAVAVLVVHDATCGTCARIARDLPGVLRVPVRLRSCRDPDLHPGVPVTVRACRVPAVGTVHADGTVRWYRGLRGAPALLRLVRPRALPRAAGVLIATVTARRTSRTRGMPAGGAPGADRG